MAESPVLEGTIPEDGVVPVLREIEDRRTSGVLRWSFEGRSGEVQLVSGELAMEQPGGDAALDEVLQLKGGRFEVLQRLPPLPVSKGDETTRSGSLAVHVPADLLSYCERAGLTGILTLKQSVKGARDRRVEVLYERGELTAIRVDGQDADTIAEVFLWEDGQFDIVARSTAVEIEIDLGELVEPEPEPEPGARRDETIPRIRRRKDETGSHFLKVWEVALEKVVDDAEKARPQTRTGPPLPPAPATKPSTRPPPARRKDATVKVIVRSTEPNAAHPPKDVELTRTPTETAPSAPPGEERGTLASTLGWMLVVVLLGLSVLALLAMWPAAS